MALQRKTIQREIVLKTLEEVPGHATADEIYQRIAEEYPNISRGTVYRNLNQLSESGEARRVEVPGGADRFEHKTQPHYHIRCRVCGRVFDVDMEYLDHLKEQIRDAHGFLIEGHDIMFRGICPDCRKKENLAKEA